MIDEIVIDEVVIDFIRLMSSGRIVHANTEHCRFYQRDYWRGV